MDNHNFKWVRGISDSQLHVGGAFLQFTPLIFYRVQVRGLEWPQQKLSFVTSFVFLRFVFGLLYGWKIQTWPIIRFILFLRVSHLFYFFYLMVFDRIHDAMCLSKMSRTSSRNIDPHHKKYSSIFHCTHVGAVWQLKKKKRGFLTRNSTIFCNSPAVVLGESLATQTLFLTVH